MLPEISDRVWRPVAKHRLLELPGWALWKQKLYRHELFWFWFHSNFGRTLNEFTQSTAPVLRLPRAAHAKSHVVRGTALRPLQLPWNLQPQLRLQVDRFPKT